MFNFKTFGKKLIKFIIKQNNVRELIEDDVAKEFDSMGDFTDLDSIKSKLIQIIINSALNHIFIVNGVLSVEDTKIISDLIIKYCHKAEKAVANQLKKKNKLYKKTNK